MSTEGLTSRAARSAARRPLRWSPFSLSVGALVAVAVFLVLYPLGVLIGTLFVGDGALTGQSFQQGLNQPRLGEMLGNTLTLVGVSGAAALAIGALFAWLNERTDSSFGAAGELLPIVALLVPPIAGTIGWALLLSPRTGLLNVALRGLLGLVGLQAAEGPLNLYSFPGLIFVTTLYLVPYVYLLVSAALRNFDPALEEASRLNGAGPVATLLQVTLPGVAPALAASALLVTMTGLAMFSVPVILGTPARIEVLAVRIYRLITASFPPKIAEAVALSFSMLVVVQVGLLVEAVIARSGRHSVIGGRGVRASRLRLGLWRWPLRGVLAAYLLATTALPLLGLLLVSLQRFLTPGIVWEQLTFDNYRSVILVNKLTSTALRNSLLLGAAGGTLSMLVAAVLAVAMRRSRTVGRLVDAVTALPATIPHTVMGVALLIAFSRAPFDLHGTWQILLIAYLVLYLPQTVRAANAALSQVGRELSEASQVCGVGEAGTFRQIVLPLMIPGLVAGWVIAFVHMVGEVTASALLYTAGTPVIGPALLDLWENGTFPQLAALALVISLMNTVIVLSVLRTARNSFRVTLGS